MTTTQTGTEYDARMRRAERLSSEHAFASEVLDFYQHIAGFQKALRANIAASNEAKSKSAPAAELRDPLDLTVLLRISADSSPPSHIPPRRPFDKPRRN